MLWIVTSNLYLQQSEQLFDSQSHQSTPDIEDIGQRPAFTQVKGQAKVTSVKRKRSADDIDDVTKSWRDVLGPTPPMGKTRVSD